MASRRKSRILAFQALFSWDLSYSQTGNTALPEGLLDFPWISGGKYASSALEKESNEEKTLTSNEETSAFSRLLVTGTVENIRVIDDMIKSHLEHWDIKRVSRVDLAILRMSVYALMFQDDIAPSIVINEAIGISKEFGTEDSYRFVNGVLDSINKFLDGKKKNEK